MYNITIKDSHQMIDLRFEGWSMIAKSSFDQLIDNLAGLCYHYFIYIYMLFV